MGTTNYEPSMNKVMKAISAVSALHREPVRSRICCPPATSMLGDLGDRMVTWVRDARCMAGDILIPANTLW